MMKKHRLTLPTETHSLSDILQDIELSRRRDALSDVRWSRRHRQVLRWVRRILTLGRWWD